MKEKKHKLLIIGAGIGQVPLVEKAHARGIHVTVVSPDGPYPCLKMADEVCNLDIYDRDAVVEYARTHGITAVASDQNDLMMPTVAYVSEKLGLPGNHFDQVWAYCNKNIYRKNCEKLGIPVPRHSATEHATFPTEMAGQSFPWIVKPEDSQSSIGVTRVDAIDELEPAIELALSKSHTHRAIVEEFFKGHEVVCEGFIYRGVYHLLAFADRKYFNLEKLMIPSQTLFPSMVDKVLLDQIVDYETRMAKHIGLSFAIVHSEYLIDLVSHEIRVVESAPRGGGVYISSHLVPLATGIDVNELLLDCVLGVETDMDARLSSCKRAAAGYICFCLPEGVVESVSGIDEIKKFSFVAMTCLDGLKVGVKTGPMLYKGARKGPVLVFAGDRTQMDEQIRTIQSVLDIQVRTADGRLAGIIWG